VSQQYLSAAGFQKLKLKIKKRPTFHSSIYWLSCSLHFIPSLFYFSPPNKTQSELDRQPEGGGTLGYR
jgi:hypothetical protein